VGFVGRSRYGDEYPQWVAFVRGNVALRVMAHDLRPEQGRPSLAAVARRLDAAVQRARVLEQGEAVPRPTLVGFTAARTRLRAGETLPLSVDAREAEGSGEPALRFLLAGGATGYVELDAAGVWTLHTTGPGPLELTVVALGANGTFARSTLALDVAPE
jgi:hypothetical protein